MKTLFRNKAFLIHATAAGINGAVYSAFATLLGQATVSYFPVKKNLTYQSEGCNLLLQNGEELAGRLGLIMVIMGMCGSISNGFILDKTKKYKQVSKSLKQKEILYIFF